MPLARRLALSVWTITFCVVTLSSTSATGAVLLVNGSGLLTGATGVNVGGTLYDVEFVDGTCIAVFDGCDDGSDFALRTLSEAEAASQALLDQVFLDVPGLGMFDSTPSLTYGCPGDIDNVCFVEIFFGNPGPHMVFLVVFNEDGEDRIGGGTTSDFEDFDLASDPKAV